MTLTGWFISGFALLVAAALGLWVADLRRQLALSRSHTRQAQKEQEAVLTLIDRIGEKITSKIDLDETLHIINEYIVQATRSESGAIFVLGDDNLLQARVIHGPFPPLHKFRDEEIRLDPYPAERMLADRIEPGEGILGLVLEQGEPLLIADPEADPRFPRNPRLLAQVRSLILCPLRVRGNVLGVFVVVNKHGELSFDSRDLALLQALADQAAVTVDLVNLYDVLTEQQRLEQELSIAHDFQRMLLPRTFPRIEGFELFATSEPATIVGGDYFDFFEIDDDHLGLVIADVSGKGIPGALIMAMVRAVLRAEARTSLSPREVLCRVNDHMLQDTRENVFITLIYAILCKSTRRLRFVRAGHEPLLILGAGGRVRQYDPDGIAIGLVGPDIFSCNEEMELDLDEGDAVVCYTDGVVEAMDQGSTEYGRERLVRRLGTVRGRSAQALVESITDDIHQFTLGIPQHDDLTMLALCVGTPARSGDGADPVVADESAPLGVRKGLA